MNVMELFSCSGGMALGFRRAGIIVTEAYDFSAEACDSYAANLGHRPIQIDVRDLLRMAWAGWRPAERIDLLICDPPCTPWSRAGSRLGTDDPDDMLVQTCELITLLRPRAYLIGNVPGLNDRPQWRHVQEHIGGLREHGYCVRDFAELDAASHGVPQHRIRPFWFGHLSGPCIKWPAPTHGDPARGSTLPGMPELRPWVTCRQALGHLPLEDLGRPVRMKMKPKGGGPTRTGSTESRCSSADDPARVVTAAEGRMGGQILLANDKHPLNELDAPSNTVRTKIGAIGAGAGVLRIGEREPNPNMPPADPDAPVRTVPGARDQALLAWPWDRPSTTIARDPRIPAPGHHDEWSILSGANAVVLSERAAKILQGLPESWVLAGKTKTARWSMLGMAMPPPLAEAVGRSVLEQVEASGGASMLKAIGLAIQQAAGHTSGPAFLSPNAIPVGGAAPPGIAHDFEACPLPPDRCEECRTIYRAIRGG